MSAIDSDHYSISGRHRSESLADLYRIMLLGDNVIKLAVTRYQHTPKGVLKQTPRPVVGFVDGFGVGIKKVGELFQ
jgi:hypothetical protein